MIVHAVDVTASDRLLRYITSLLLSDDAYDAARRQPIPEMTAAERADAAVAARTVAARLCVPRDMGAPAAKVLRVILAIVADRLEALLPSAAH